MIAIGSLLPAVQPAEAAFPGANGVIAFSAELSGNFEVWTIRPDGTGDQRLTRCPTEDASLGCFDPAWSPDGRRLAATRMQRLGGVLTSDIVVMNADGSDLHPIFTEAVGIVYQPVWSPDGTRIAFVRQDTNAEIWTVNSDGSSPAQLTTTTGGSAQAPSWSPDGRSIAYASKGEIYLMDADGTNQRPITLHPAGDFHPDWAPDGKRIVFGSDRTTGVGKSSVWSMNADGSDQVELASNPNGIDYTPAYSPDGTQIVFMSNRSGEEELWAMKADGTEPRRLTFNPDSFDAQADWQPIPPAPPPLASPMPPPAPPLGGERTAPSPGPGRVSITRTVWVGRASVRAGLPVSCGASGSRCAGTITLRARWRALRSKRRGLAAIGRARFSLRAGQSARAHPPFAAGPAHAAAAGQPEGPRRDRQAPLHHGAAHAACRTLSDLLDVHRRVAVALATPDLPSAVPSI